MGPSYVRSILGSADTPFRLRLKQNTKANAPAPSTAKTPAAIPIYMPSLEPPVFSGSGSFSEPLLAVGVGFLVLVDL